MRVFSFMLEWFFTSDERWAHQGFSTSGGLCYGVHDEIVVVAVFFNLSGNRLLCA
jgi:hypothetical protein